jgi:ABC-type transport system involved in multi-copper enzyme maturation permease subunit
MAVAGAVYATLSVGMVLATLATMGVAVSSLFNNTVLAVVAVALVWFSLGFIFSFLDISFLSPANLVDNLPEVIAGEYSAAEQWKIVGSFAGLMAFFPTLAVVVFMRKDL